jgi:hypothetical protein
MRLDFVIVLARVQDIEIGNTVNPKDDSFAIDQLICSTPRTTIRDVSARSDVLDLDCDDVAAAELAVDCQIEHGEVPSAAFNLEFCPDRPDVFWSQRRLGPQFALVPGQSFMRRRVAFT